MADEQVRGTLLTPAQVSDWGNTTRFIEPTLRNEVGEDVRTADTTEDEPDITTVDDAIEAQETIAEAEPVITAEDPGDYTPKDYSFDVTVYDTEGKNGRSVKIESPEEWDKLLESDPNLGNAAALAKGLRQAAKMEGSQERDKEDYDKRKADYDGQVEAETGRVEAINNMANEITYLVDGGDLPAVAAKYKDADWSDPEVAKQPGIKEQIALLSFMRNENTKRQKLGIKPMTSVVDAFNAFERQNSKTRTADDKRAAGEARKAAGAVVSAPSPSQNTSAPKGISVGRGGNLRDVGRGW